MEIDQIAIRHNGSRCWGKRFGVNVRGVVFFTDSCGFGLGNGTIGCGDSTNPRVGFTSSNRIGSFDGVISRSLITDSGELDTGSASFDWHSGTNDA